MVGIALGAEATVTQGPRMARAGIPLTASENQIDRFQPVCHGRHSKIVVSNLLLSDSRSISMRRIAARLRDPHGHQHRYGFGKDSSLANTPDRDDAVSVESGRRQAAADTLRGVWLMEASRFRRFKMRNSAHERLRWRRSTAACSMRSDSNHRDGLFGSDGNEGTTRTAPFPERNCRLPFSVCGK